MSGPRGSEFGIVQPLAAGGAIQTNANLVWTPGQFGLDNGFMKQLTPTDAFRLGQQIFFWVGIYNPVVAGNFWTQVQIKPYWLRPNREHRAPGTPTPSPQLELPPGSGWSPLDNTTFHPGPVVGAPLDQNMYTWIPSPKRLDITEYAPLPGPPLPSPPRNSASEMEDDFWQWNLQDPTTAAYAALFVAPQIVSRWSAFFYPAMGYALAFKANATAMTPTMSLPLDVNVTYAAGTLGGENYQESIG